MTVRLRPTNEVTGHIAIASFASLPCTFFSSGHPSELQLSQLLSWRCPLEFRFLQRTVAFYFSDCFVVLAIFWASAEANSR